jgi:SAM-dependent methyltransferase
MGTREVNLWPSAEHALDYLRRADSIPHRVEGEAALLEFVPASTTRVLDLGSGADRLLSLVMKARPSAVFVALDFSPTMLHQLRGAFSDDKRVSIIRHDFDNPLPNMGRFDTVISSLRFITFGTCVSGNCIRKFSMCSLRAAFSVIWSTSPRRRRSFTAAS